MVGFCSLWFDSHDCRNVIPAGIKWERPVKLHNGCGRSHTSAGCGRIHTSAGCGRIHTSLGCGCSHTSPGTRLSQRDKFCNKICMSQIDWTSSPCIRNYNNCHPFPLSLGLIALSLSPSLSFSLSRSLALSFWSLSLSLSLWSLSAIPEPNRKKLQLLRPLCTPCLTVHGWKADGQIYGQIFILSHVH